MLRPRPASPVARTVVEGVVLCALTTLLALSVAIVWVRVVPAQHTAVAVVAPATVLSLAPPAEGAGRPPARAADDPLPLSAPFPRAIELLSGGALAGDLAADADLLRAVLGAGADGSVAAALADLFAAAIGRPAGDRPDADRLRAHLRTRFMIEPTAQPGFRRLSYRHADPRTAERLIARAVALADERLRRSALEQATGLVADLRRRLADGTGPTDRRVAIAALLEEQERRAVLLATGRPHAIEFVHGPTAGERPDAPDPLVVMTLVGLAGIAGGLLPFWRRVASGR